MDAANKDPHGVWSPPFCAKIQKHLNDNTLRELSNTQLSFLVAQNDRTLRELLDSTRHSGTSVSELREWCRVELGRASLFDRFREGGCTLM